MSPTASTPDPRESRLGRVAASVYRYAMVELGFLLAAAPGLAGLAVVAPDPRSIPLYALCAVPVGPAFAAALYALREGTRGDAPDPWPRFWRGWRINVLDVLRVWLPALTAAAVIGIGIAFGPATGVDPVLIVIAWVVLVLLALWTGLAIVIASLFSFRARDVARLALHYLAARPLATLGFAALLVLAVALVFVATGWLVALAASVFAALTLVNARPVTRDIADRFVAPGPGAGAAPDEGPRGGG